MIPSQDPPADAYRAAYALSLFISSASDQETLQRAIPPAVLDVLGCESVLLLTAGKDPGKFSMCSLANGGDAKKLDDKVIELSTEPTVEAWRKNLPTVIDPAGLPDNSSLRSIFQVLAERPAYSAAATGNGIMYGAIIAQDAAGEATTGSAAERGAILGVMARTIGIALANAWRYQKAEEERIRRADEMNMLAQIDREMSDSIRLDSVFAMTLDWALRYTLSHGAYLSLLDEATGRLRVVASLGYEQPPESLTSLFENGGIPQRVVATHRAEIIPDVSVDSGHIPVSIAMRSHLSMPITLEDQVVAVISLESRRINAFTDAHVDFINKLGARAGIAIDNARLYADAVREREQTASILREIADVVIVVGHDERILLINSSAINVFRLYTDQRYTGRKLSEVFEDHLLLHLYRRAVVGGQVLSDQITLHGDRPYAASFAPHSDISWIITMHDLTELRRADQIKRDFISVLSHDLKQPVSVIKGYVELLEMHNADFNERSRRYIGMVFQSLENMRKLIDDMLDLARLDSDFDITHTAVTPARLITNVQDWIRPSAEAKSMRVEASATEGMPALSGDESRLTQILVNLVHNAVKYTPPGGMVRIDVERLGDALRFAVRDNGIGISPDDQKAIFDRFYRVRRPETENIEGSGVGLALVKRLVDLHNGQIGVESRLGEGTTFYVTLPIWKE